MSNGQNLSFLNRYFNPSLEPLIAKYLEYKNRIDLLEKQGELPDRQKPDGAAASFCREKLKEVEIALFPGRGRRRKIIAAWQLLHRVSEELILLMKREELYSFGLRLTHQLEMAALPEAQKKIWLEKVNSRLDLQNSPAVLAPGFEPEAADRETRHLFKNIYREINNIVDDNFWDLWAKKFVAVLYLFLFVLCLGVLSCLLIYNDPGCLSLPIILFLGAVGGLTSGLLTGERETFPKGHFYSPLLYYVLVRPALGALTALVVFFAVESHFLIRINPPLKQPVLACEKSDKPVDNSSEKPASAALSTPSTNSNPVTTSVSGTALTQPEGAPLEKTPAIANSPSSSQEKPSLAVSTVTLETIEGKQHYLYMLILFIAGFSGDKLLKSIADRVTMKLMAQAEKTKEAL